VGRSTIRSTTPIGAEGRERQLRHTGDGADKKTKEVKTAGKVARTLKSGGWPRLLPEIALRI
jgi:hypothetical protein